MPLALIAIGIIAVVTAINGTFKDLVTQLEKDLSGQFLYWLVAVIIVGSIGYIPGWERPSRLFLALAIITLILANGGVFNKLTQALQQGPKVDANGVPLADINTAPSVDSGQGGVGNVSGGTLGQIQNVAGTLASNLPSSVSKSASGAAISAQPTNPLTGLGIGGV